MRAAAIATVLLLGAAGSPAAEPIPLPRVDFAAVYDVTAAQAPPSRMAVRHGGGLLRLEITMQGSGSATGYVDLASKRAVMVMPVSIPGAPLMGVEMDGSTLPKAWTEPEGRRIGTDRVLGESCDLWEYIDPSAGVFNTSCITADGLLLRSETQQGTQTIARLEAMQISRAAQDRAALRPPKNLAIMKMPGGLSLGGAGMAPRPAPSQAPQGRPRGN